MLQATARTAVFLSILTIISPFVYSQADCTNAAILIPSTTCSPTTGDLQGAVSASPTGACGGATSTTTNGVWFKFIATSPGATITLSGLSSPSNLTLATTFMELLNGTCPSSFTSLACQDASSPLNLTNLVTGTTYYLRVYVTGSTTSGGNPNRRGFDICVQSSPNDDCVSAISLTSATTCSATAGSLLRSTATTGLPSGCESGGVHYDVWYSFVALSASHTITISNRGSNFTNPEIQLYSGTCGSLTSLQCGTTSITSTSLTIGNIYRVRVSNIGSSPASNGGFDICVTHPTPPVIVSAGRMKEIFQQTILSPINGLNDPWEITYGPDGYIWITEAKGYKAYRMDPATWVKTTVLDISQGASGYLTSAEHTAFNVQFASNFSPWPQGGFAGLAIHPKFMDATTPKNYVYISYVHKYDSTSSTTNGGVYFRNSVVRFTYNTSTGKLDSPVALCDTLPGSSDHNSQRMIIAPVNGTDYLFYGQGDMGAGQFANQYRPNKAQNSDSYEGKILRFNLEADGDAGTLDKWIPNDNPYNGASQSAVWCIGIRNNQGFAYDTTSGTLYGSSHGPYSDDEINIIQQAKNYGHPLVIGYAADGNYNGSTAGSPNTTSTCPLITDEAAAAAAIPNYKDPLYSAYAQSQTIIHNIWVTNPNNGTWPSEAWSGLDIYKHTLIPGWKNSLVPCSLKWGRVLRLKLGPLANTIIPTDGADTVSYFGSTNRFRDLSFAPNGKDMYVIMDKSATTSGPSASNPIVPACGGCVVKYTFLGYADAGGKSSIPDAIDVTAGAANSCTNGTTVTIDNTNDNLWVPITGTDGNIMAEIYANGNNLGNVASSFYTNAGAIRIKNGIHYLDRNITITPQNQPSSTVKIRLYLSKAEYNALDLDPVSGVSSIGDLKILKNSDACGSAMVTATVLITPTYAEAHGTDGYMLQGNINSFSTFYFSSSNFTLPLQLLTFKGSLQNNTTLLEWETTNEINTSDFIIERSVDGADFKQIGTVAAKGNSGNVSSYSFVDYDAANQSSLLVYYRLKMVDVNGSFSYSKIVSVRFNSSYTLYIYPNPVDNVLRIKLSLPKADDLQIEITDMNGRIVYKKSKFSEAGAGEFKINAKGWPSQMYSVRVVGSNNGVLVIKNLIKL